jgi:hypothetical protein
MAELVSQAKPEIEKLMQSDVNQLYEELGIRVKAYGNDLSVATSFAPQVAYTAELMGPLDDLRLFGKEFFGRVNRQAYELVCGNALTDKKDRAKLEGAFKIGPTDVAAYLAVLLVGHFGLAAGAAAVVAALIIKLFFKPGHEAMCLVWATKLPKPPKAKKTKSKDKKKKT